MLLIESISKPQKNSLRTLIKLTNYCKSLIRKKKRDGINY